MTDIRSNQCVFVSHCILAQCVRANGLAKYYPGPVKPVLQFCLDHDINMIQMPCPETLCASGGLGRDPHGKVWYENNGLRETASKIAEGQVAYMRELTNNSYQILAIIGMEFSPACAVTYLNKGPVIYKAQGIYIEEVQRLLKESSLDIPFIGVNQRALKKLAQQLDDMLPNSPAQTSASEDSFVDKQKSRTKKTKKQASNLELDLWNSNQLS